MEHKKGGDLVCQRPNSIVEARFKLSKFQNDIIDIVLANVEDDDKLHYEISLDKYAKLYNYSRPDVAYTKLKHYVNTFEGKGFKIYSNDGNEKFFSWFSSITYLNNERKIIVELGQDLKNLMIKVKQNVFYDIRYPLNFSSVYSQRLYYYFKRFEDTGYRIDRVSELRTKLQIPKGYSNFSEIERRILIPSVNEINEKSDINVSYNKKKTGKAYTHLEFFIERNSDKKTAKDECKEKKDLIKLSALLSAYDLDISKNDIEIIYKYGNYDYKYINKIIVRIGDTLLNKNNPVGYLINYIKNNYEEPKKRQTRGNISANRYVERCVGRSEEEMRSVYEELEKTAIGYGGED